MKKAKLAIIILLLFFSITPVNVFAVEQNTIISIDGEIVEFNRSTGYPFLDGNSRTQVPFRVTLEKFGAKVDWNASTKTIVAVGEAANVQLVIGNQRAIVNGKSVTLDTPAMIIRGATMVPVRFVSEAMGAEVEWIEAMQTVSITTSKKYAAASLIIPAGTVIPVKLDKGISSAINNVGDGVSAVVCSTREGDAEFPKGTYLLGVIQAVQRKSAGQPGMLDLTFNEVRLPDGRKIGITGSLLSLDDKSVSKSADGRLMAKDKTGSERLKFIAIGAGAGVLIGKLTKQNTTTSGLLGAAAGYIYSEINKDKVQAADVTVSAGGIKQGSLIKHILQDDFT